MLFIGTHIEMSPVVKPTVLNYGFKVFLVLILSMSDAFHYSLASIQLITRNSFIYLFIFLIFLERKVSLPLPSLMVPFGFHFWISLLIWLDM